MNEDPAQSMPSVAGFLVKSADFLGVPSGNRGLQHPARQAPDTGGITVVWARHLDQVRAAQRLRFDIFVNEMGARLPLSGNHAQSGHDIDMFDDYCEHLLVLDRASREVVGTYRVLTPAQAKRVGTTYTDGEFDLTRLRADRERMVELGRSCVRSDRRQGGVILALGAALFRFMVRNQFEAMIGCASIPMIHNGHACGSPAASVWRRLRRDHLAPIEHQVFPRCPLPIERLDATLDVKPPALIKGYLRLGAKVLGPPAWDPAFNAADLPIMARLEDLPARYRKRFLGA